MKEMIFCRPCSVKRALLASLISRRSVKSLSACSLCCTAPSTSFCITIEGKALMDIMDSEELTENLLLLGQMCKAVVACRVSPDQRAQEGIPDGISVVI